MFTFESPLPPLCRRHCCRHHPSFSLLPPSQPQMLATLIAPHTICVDWTPHVVHVFVFFALCGGGAEHGLSGRRTHLSRKIDVQSEFCHLFCFLRCLQSDASAPTVEREETVECRVAPAGRLVAVFRTELVTKALNWNLADWLLLQSSPS